MTNDSEIQLSVLGGGGEVGANCFQIACNGHSLLLDCGTHPKKEGRAALPEFDLLRQAPQGVIITHGHQDHCGSLPFLLRQFPGTWAYATKPTLRILDRMLHNSVAVMELLSRERGITEYPLYTHDDVNYAMGRTHGFEFHQQFSLPMGNERAEVVLIEAGHVLGSSSVLLRLPNHTLFYTSDICESDQELLGGHSLLDLNIDVDTLIIESTHGATEEARFVPYQAEADRLGEAAAAVLSGGGCVLIPSFALGRTQEVLNIVARLQQQGAIPDVPVYASGLGRAVYEIYERFSEYLRPQAELRSLEEFDRIGNVWDPAVVRDLLSEPCIIVATSGMMLPNTPSAMIAQEMVQHSQHGIFFPGYLDHETLGYHLLHAPVGARLQFALGKPEVVVKLENIKRFHFTGHTPRAQLQRVVQHFKPRNVVYVHGDPDAIAWMEHNTPEGSTPYSPAIGQTLTLSR